MKNIDIFSKSLSKSLSVRKKSLTLLKHSIAAETDQVAKLCLLRATLPELCAHYEGFFTDAFQSLFEYLRQENVSNDLLDINYLIFHIALSIDENIAKQHSKVSKLRDIFHEIFTENSNLLSRINIMAYNIKPDHIPKTLDVLKIDYEASILNNMNILYSKRNSISHGEIFANKVALFSLKDTTKLTEGQLNAANQQWVQAFNNSILAMNHINDIFISYVSSKKYLNNSGRYEE